MRIELVYMAEQVEFIRSIEVSTGTIVENAIRESGLLAKFPEVDLDKNQVGIYGTVVPLNTTLQEGDRIEIYQSLRMDPMQARRLRAEQNADNS